MSRWGRKVWTMCVKKPYDRLETGLVFCRVVVLGDRNCGKTTMVSSQTADAKPQVGVGQWRVYTIQCEAAVHPGVHLEVWDCAGHISKAEIQQVPDVHVIILCFDASEPETLDSITRTWLPLARERWPKQGLFLVACKCELRNDIDTITSLAERRLIAITYDQAAAISRLAAAIAYVETSAKRCPATVHQVFEAAALHHVGKLTKRHLVFQRQRSVEKHRPSRSRSSSSSYHGDKWRIWERTSDLNTRCTIM